MINLRNLTEVKKKLKELQDIPKKMKKVALEYYQKGRIDQIAGDYDELRILEELEKEEKDVWKEQKKMIR